MTVSHEGEFVESTPRRHVRRSSIHHPQLRDLLVCPEGDMLFYAVDKRIDSYCLDSHMGATAVDLVFRPHALTVAMGCLVACGPAGELFVRALHDDETVFEGKINHSINNGCSITTNEHTGRSELYVASNAQCVHTFNLETMVHERDVSFPACMNYCALNRDGSMMAAVGDTEKMYLCDTRNDYKKIAVLNDMKGFGFGCTFDWSSRAVAAASQDGETVIWDVRTMRPINTLYSRANDPASPARSKQACRQVKYSPTSMVDLMVFTEQNGYFHVVDGRNYHQEQMVEVDKDRKGIAGVCFNPDGNKLFVAVANDSIYEYTIDEASRRRFADGSLI